METINDLPKGILNYLWKWEYNHWAEEGKERNIEEELNNFGYSLVEKDCIGEYNDLRGYLNFEIIPFEESD